MHAWLMRMCSIWLTVYACSISWSEVLNYIPCTWTWLWYCSFLFRVSAWSRSRGKAPGYVISYDYLNWSNMHLRATACFTLSLHWQLTSRAQSGNQSCKSHINTDVTGNSCTLLHHWAGLNMTMIPLCLECILSLRRPLPFSTGGLGWTGGRTDKNRQTIAVILCLCLRFAARVNKIVTFTQ